MCSIELIGEFRLAAVLQAVHRFMQQRAFERSIAAVVVAAEADAVARRGVEPIQAIWAVVQQQHMCLAGDLHLCDQSEEAQACRCTQDFWPSFGSVRLISLWMLLRCRQSTSSIATRATTRLAVLPEPAAISSGRLIAANTLASDT